MGCSGGIVPGAAQQIGRRPTRWDDPVAPRIRLQHRAGAGCWFQRYRRVTCSFKRWINSRFERAFNSTSSCIESTHQSKNVRRQGARHRAYGTKVLHPRDALQETVVLIAGEKRRNHGLMANAPYFVSEFRPRTDTSSLASNPRGLLPRLPLAPEELPVCASKPSF